MVSLSIPSYVNWSNIRRFGKMLPYYWADGSVVHQEAMQRLIAENGYKNFGQTLKASALETEAAYKAMLQKEGGFFKYATNTFRNLPGELSKAWTAGGAAATAAGKSGLWGSIKGLGSAISKRLPLIGSVIYLATEVPNIYRATVDGGIVTGGGEALKAAARVTGFTAGMAIGQALCPIPIVGGIIGGIAGEWIASKLTGKSYSEMKEENKQEAKAEIQEQGFDTGSTNPFANGVDPQQLAYLQQMVAQDPRFQYQYKEA